MQHTLIFSEEGKCTFLPVLQHLSIMMEQGVGANTVSGVMAPGNVYMIQARNPVAPGSKGQPVGMATYLTSRATESDAGRANLQTPRVVIQNPAEVNATQDPPTVLQHRTAVAGLQTPPGEIQYSLGTTDLQTQPGGPQNPPTCAPGPMYTSNQFQWNMPFGSFFTFDPKKFIKDEVRTLGVSVISLSLQFGSLHEPGCSECTWIRKGMDLEGRGHKGRWQLLEVGSGRLHRGQSLPCFCPETILDDLRGAVVTTVPSGNCHRTCINCPGSRRVQTGRIS